MLWIVEYSDDNTMNTKKQIVEADMIGSALQAFEYDFPDAIVFGINNYDK